MAGRMRRHHVTAAVEKARAWFNQMEAPRRAPARVAGYSFSVVAVGAGGFRPARDHPSSSSPETIWIE